MPRLTVTLADHLAAAHRHSLSGGPDPAQACANDVTRAEVEAMRAELQQVAARSHVARVQVAFLDRVLRLIN